MKHVLSLDGGGIRGVIPAVVLAELEKKTGKKTGELFDLIAGTSTGGILALGLCKDSGTGEPEYGAGDIVNLYRDNGERIFSRTSWRKVKSLGGLVDEKYSQGSFESVVEEYFQGEPFGNALNKVLITTYDIQNRKPFFLKSWKKRFASMEMKNVIRATTAAPTYFEPALTAMDDSTITLVDGGVFMNNPAVSAYVEAMKLFPGEEIKLVSIGTGESTDPIAYNDAKNWGLAGWARPLLSCMMDGVSDAANYQMKQLLGGNYIRLQIRLDNASDNLDDASGDNINLLVQEAQRLIEVHKSEIDSIF